MSLLREVELSENFGPFAIFRESIGFVPNLLRAQTLLPRVIEAQAKLESAVRFADKALSRVQKERILLIVAAARRDAYCVSIHRKVLSSLGLPDAQINDFLKNHRHAGLPAAEVALLDFCVKLTTDALSVSSRDIERLRVAGFEDESIHEAVLVTALASYRHTLSVGLGPEPDFGPLQLPPKTGNLGLEAAFQSRASDTHQTVERKGPYLRAPYLSPTSFAPFDILQKSHGFIPNFFRSQTLRPDLLEAEAEAVGVILMPEDILTRSQKEYILLAVSAANLNSYCVAVHCNLLRGQGMPPEESDQIAVDHHQSDISEADKALVDFALKVGVRPSEFRREDEDIDRLRTLGFTQEQILECMVVTALNNFANTLQMGLGIAPDFEPPPAFEQKKVHLCSPGSRQRDGSSVSPLPATAVEDPDAGLVASAQSGDLEAFEELIRRHSRCIYRALLAILGDSEEAKDAMQDALLSAFEHIAGFQGRSKISTWLVSIARNTALQQLRNRKNTESLDEGELKEGEFRPRQVRAWRDNPEEMHSESERRQLVERAIMGLPAKYRIVVMMRDIEQLSTDEVARQLGVSVPALKTRLLRGRLMLRESLSPHFTAGKAAV